MNQILKILFYNEYVDLNLSQSLVQLVYIRMTYSELGSKFDVVLVILRVGYLTVLSFFFLPSICKLLRYAKVPQPYNVDVSRTPHTRYSILVQGQSIFHITLQLLTHAYDDIANFKKLT